MNMTAQSTADLLPESEGLGSRMSPGKLPTRTAGSDACATANAMTSGTTFECNRIGKRPIRTSSTECIGYYRNALRRGDRIACFECAKLNIFLKEIGEAMARPAKKGTPDPIGQEAEEVVSREIQTKPVVDQKEPILINKPADPLAGLTKYDPTVSSRKGEEPFVRMHKNGFDPNAAATEEYGFDGHSTVDVYYEPAKDGKLGRIVIALAGDKGALHITRIKARRGAKISAAGVLTRAGITVDGSVRLDIKELAPGVLELIPQSAA